MGELCGVKTGWMRVGYFDGKKESKCPNDNFVSKNFKNYRVCRAKGTGTVHSKAYCASVPMESHGVKYSQVCGTAAGYQAGSTIGLEKGADINSPYLNGVSITRTVSTPQKRSHVFSLISGVAERYTAQFACPCNEGSTLKPPAYIGNDYYCESGIDYPTTNPVIIDSDPLWDQKKFRYNEKKCLRSKMPWFSSSIPPATNDLELRLCRVKPRGIYGEVFLESFAIYIR